jgi:hypothetical protein
MTFAFTDGLNVTTWGADPSGAQVWRARNDTSVAEFAAPRDAPVEDLHRLALAALTPSHS